ncbi:MAG: hypothetical protein IT322_07465 [Anaerolineae bacterium]|nr:hypothetical protein [Anaerolineae bacterium]CAG0961133.1 hypothetical protein ANRL4_00677 [Anaerolineae bacterium]
MIWPKPVGVGLLLVALLSVGCGGNNSPTPTASLPTMAISPSAPSASAPPPAAEPLIWLEQPFGTADTLAVLFYEDEITGIPCIRYMIKAPVSRCATRGDASMVAVYGVEDDSNGQTFTVVAGRVLRPEVAVISVVFADGQSFPVTVAEGGIILLAPGQGKPLEAVPIDQFGNIVGEIFRF